MLLSSTGVVTMAMTAVSSDTGVGLATILEQYAEEIARCRYGSFRGVIKDGRIVIFAIEHEWRPEVEARRQATRSERAG
jgi:hypothetical protein